MARMIVHRGRELPSNQAVIGPCPGCELWTVQYDERLVGMAESPYSPPEFLGLVETLLQEHLLNCPGLQEIVDTL